MSEPSRLEARPRLGQRVWRRFCRFAVSVFYRRFEVAHAERIPEHGPVLLCANHVNALVDAVVVQAASPRPVHPLARSGLFRRPLLRPILALIQAVPIYRRPAGDASGAATAAHNDASFRRLFAYLRSGRALLIFPEGQSHSDPSLRPIKTGAARIALGAWRDHGRLPTVVPVGLIFTHKGRFRGDVLVQVGEPVQIDLDADAAAELDERAVVGRFTEAIAEGLFAVTLNVDSWDDVALLGLVRRFAELRREPGALHKQQPSSLARRYRIYKRLYETHRLLRLRQPQRVDKLRSMLVRFERLCRRYGVQDFHLHLRYRPALILRFALRSIAFVLFALPLALWGLVMSGVPYALARTASKRAARGRDQYDSASMLFGLVFFGLFWGGQCFLVWHYAGTTAAAIYAASLPLTAAVALVALRERRRITENVRVFFLFLRQSRVRDYLRAKREEIEAEIAGLEALAVREQPRRNPPTEPVALHPA